MTEPITRPGPQPLPPTLGPGPAAPPPPPDVGFLRGRTAGIPNWGWIAGGVIVGAAVLWWWFRRGKGPTENLDPIYGSATVVDDSSGIATGQYESILAMLRDIQGDASVPGPQGPPGPTGPPGDRFPSPTPGPIPPTPPTPTPTPPPTAPTPGRTYTIVSGDTLNGIAAKLGTTYTLLYTANAVAIEAAARAHGRTSSRGGPNNSLGWWIYPGTRLVY